MWAIEHNATNQGFAAGSALGNPVGDFETLNSATLRERAVGVFCAECHLGAYATAAAGASTNVYGSGNGAFSGHRIMATGTSTWNAAGDISTGQIQNTTVAWAPATNCKDCHDANDNFGNKAFPHAWGGTKMWLTSAARVGAAPSNLPYGPGNSFDATAFPQLSDGVCLKCHVASTGTEGVGLTF
jgi:hypothetical protein